MAQAGARTAQPALIGLGANLGDGPAALRSALRALSALPACRVSATSSLWRSAPVDAGGPHYWNAVVELQCALPPHDLLQALQRIEAAHGRERPPGLRNAPRTLDLDLLCFGDLCLQDPHLTLPHPRMHQRAFVLAPLAEIHPAWRLPDGSTLDQALQRLRDDGQWLERLGRLEADAPHDSPPA